MLVNEVINVTPTMDESDLLMNVQYLVVVVLSGLLILIDEQQ